LTAFFGQGAVLTAAAAAFHAEGLPSARHLFLNKSTTTAAAAGASTSTAPWSSAEMQFLAQAFFEKPRDWQHVCDALLAAGEAERDVSEIVAFFWGTFMRTAVYERWLRAPAHSVPFTFTEQQLYQEEINRRERSGTPPTPTSSSPFSSFTNSNSAGGFPPALYLGSPANGKHGGGGNKSDGNNGSDTTNGVASPMEVEGEEMGGGEHEKGGNGKNEDSAARA